jgi:hypothetical protein
MDEIHDRQSGPRADMHAKGSDVQPMMHLRNPDAVGAALQCDATMPVKRDGLIPAC